MSALLRVLLSRSLLNRKGCTRFAKAEGEIEIWTMSGSEIATICSKIDRVLIMSLFIVFSQNASVEYCFDDGLFHFFSFMVSSKDLSGIVSKHHAFMIGWIRVPFRIMMVWQKGNAIGTVGAIFNPTEPSCALWIEFN